MAKQKVYVTMICPDHTTDPQNGHGDSYFDAQEMAFKFHKRNYFSCLRERHEMKWYDTSPAFKDKSGQKKDS
ncbi:MAG: hypothetical protein ABH846_04895 [Patescibacteria group bacterium]